MKENKIIRIIEEWYWHGIRHIEVEYEDGSIESIPWYEYNK